MARGTGCPFRSLGRSAHRTWEAAILTCGFHTEGDSRSERLSHWPGVTQRASQAQAG